MFVIFYPIKITKSKLDFSKITKMAKNGQKCTSYIRKIIQHYKQKSSN